MSLSAIAAPVSHWFQIAGKILSPIDAGRLLVDIGSLGIPAHLFAPAHLTLC